MIGTRNEFTDLTSGDATTENLLCKSCALQSKNSLNIVNSLVCFQKQNVSLLKSSSMVELVSFTLKQNNTNKHTENEAALMISGMVAGEHLFLEKVFFYNILWLRHQLRNVKTKSKWDNAKSWKIYFNK